MCHRRCSFARTCATFVLTSAIGIGILANRDACASISNGGFETGDLTSWAGTGNVTVQTSQAHLDNPLSSGTDVGTWTPTEGTYFAYLLSGSGQGVYTLLSQSFAATAGDVLSFDTFFDAGDYLPFNDDGYVNLIDTVNSITIPLYAHSVATVGNGGFDGWTNVTFPITLTSTYLIEAGVRNIADNGLESAVGLDNVQLNATGAVPEAASLAVWSILLLSIAVGIRWQTQR
jgi:hypothetical protein